MGNHTSKHDLSSFTHVDPSAPSRATHAHSHSKQPGGSKASKFLGQDVTNQYSRHQPQSRSQGQQDHQHHHQKRGREKERDKPLPPIPLRVHHPPKRKHLPHDAYHASLKSDHPPCSRQSRAEIWDQRHFQLPPLVRPPPLELPLGPRGFEVKRKPVAKARYSIWPQDKAQSNSEKAPRPGTPHPYPKAVLATSSGGAGDAFAPTPGHASRYEARPLPGPPPGAGGGRGGSYLPPPGNAKMYINRPLPGVPAPAAKGSGGLRPLGEIGRWSSGKER